MANVLVVAGSNSKFKGPEAKPAGFFVGFWHGMICPFTLLVSFFKPGVQIYETNNKGKLYELGFVLGAVGTSGSGVTVTL